MNKLVFASWVSSRLFRFHIYIRIMTNLLGKCTKYQPFSGKKKTESCEFSQNFFRYVRGAAVLSGLLSVYTSSTSRCIGSKNGGWSPIKMAEWGTSWTIGFWGFPPSIFGPILSAWEYLFPNLCPVGSCQVAFGERRIQGRQNMASLVTLFIEANTSGALQVRRGF